MTIPRIGRIPRCQTLRSAVTLLLLLGPLTTIVRAAEATRRDDAYHFASYAAGEHAVNYAEWWYFNVFDAATGTQFAFTYSILDPANHSGFGAASVTSIVYTNQGHFTDTSTYSPASFFASDAQADVVIAGDSARALSFVQVLGDDAYRIVGSTSGSHSVSWNLLYVRQAGAWFGADREHVGLFPWEQMSWLQYMPGASVWGTVAVDGNVYEVTGARGYHDHNWGEWVPFTVTWNWAQYFEPGLAFSIGDFRNSDAGVASIEYLGRRSTFSKNQYRIVHGGWLYDSADADWFPTTTWLYAQNDEVTLIVSLRALDTVPVLPPAEIPLPLVPVIYEQTAAIRGWMWAKAATGEWTFVRAFDGGGFNEYTDITLPHPR